MTIYSYVMGTVVLMIEGKTYQINGPDKVEIKLPSGDYTFSAYIAYSDGTPVLKQTFSRRYNGGSFTRIYPATTGILSVGGKAELNIRSGSSALRGVSGYEQTLLEFECQNCELTNRRDGFLNESIPKMLIRGCKFRIGFMYFLAVLIMAIGVAFTVLLSGVIGEAAPMTENEFLEILPVLLSPILAVIVIAQETRNLHFIKICKNFPILNIPNEVIDYDDL